MPLSVDCPRITGTVVLCCGLLLQGCAGTPQSDQLLTQPPKILATTVELAEVPFHPQQAYQCGPAALAMLLNNQGVAITPQQLTPKLYIPEKKGSLQIELLSNTRQLGLIPYVIKPSLTELLGEIQAGNPVLVFQNLALKWYPQWHYAVVVGYDLDNNQIVLRSGQDRRRTNSLPLFERTWARAEHWAMLALKPGQLPASVEYWRYLHAVASMEKVNKFDAALAGYQAGLKNWPDDQRLMMGLSNSYHALGMLAQSAAALQRLIRSHPGYAPAYNNLAHIYLEQGQLKQAEQHARQALGLGGEHQAVYKKTLQEIRRQRQLH